MAGSPTFRLFNTLLATMVAILVGFYCVRLKVVKPAEGHLKGLGFFHRLHGLPTVDLQHGGYS